MAAPGRDLLTHSGGDFLPVQAQTTAGAHEIAIASAEHIAMQPLVVWRGEPLDVMVTVVDADGWAVEDIVTVQTIGSYGPTPLLGPQPETSAA